MFVIKLALEDEFVGIIYHLRTNMMSHIGLRGPKLIYSFFFSFMFLNKKNSLSDWVLITDLVVI